MAKMHQYDHPLLPEGVIIEMIPVGAYIKVSAIDPASGMEVSIVGDRTASTETLRSTAMRKLVRVMQQDIELAILPQELHTSRGAYHDRHTSRRAQYALKRQRQKSPPSGWDL